VTITPELPLHPAPSRTPNARLWAPKRVLVTPAALAWEHGRAMVERAASSGAEVLELRANRLPKLGGDDPRTAYREAKATLAIATAPASKRRPLE